MDRMAHQETIFAAFAAILLAWTIGARLVLAIIALTRDDHRHYLAEEPLADRTDDVPASEPEEEVKRIAHIIETLRDRMNGQDYQRALDLLQLRIAYLRQTESR